jgi:hypothetical protein
MISTCWELWHEFFVWLSCRSQPSSMESMDQYVPDTDTDLDLEIGSDELDVINLD